MAFPTDKDNLEDNIDDVLADHINTLQDKVGSGLDNNAPSLNKLLRGTGSGTSEWDKDCPSGSIVGTNDTQTLTNKTINANNNTISNLAHGSEVNNPSSGVHGVTGSLVGTSDTQTLTNKKFNDGLIINESGGNNDTRIEGGSITSLFFIDASTDRIGIGLASPDRYVHIYDADNNILLLQSTTAECIMEMKDNSNTGFIKYVGSSDNFYVGGNFHASMSTTLGLTYRDELTINCEDIYAENLYDSSAANSDLRYSTSTGRIYYQTSSKRFKFDIGELEVDTKQIYNLKPKSFTDKATKQRGFGLIAEEVFKYIPEIVPLDKKGRPLSVNYKMLSVLLLNEMKEMKSEIKEMKKKINSLEAK
jgi:hypothetical protein